ncbi:sulfurtransferase [Roseovarius sp. D22-M7]|uniref:sulfurtransferase n=1 Tax=Roseovarius sp. D22-M7 TaxID=3127116 RepID=UPI00300FC8E0
MLMTLRATCIAAATAIVPAVAEAELGPLVEPSDLRAAMTMTEPTVLDIRSAETYREGHVPGALNAPYGLFRGPSDNPGQLVSEGHMTEVLRGLGIKTDTPVVVVHQGTDQTDFGAAARVYWTLKTSGVSPLAILNGGMNGWTEAGQEIATGPAPEITPSEITVSYSDQWLATREDVKAIVDGEENAQLVDARPEAFWKGQTKHGAAAQPGTLPQSRYFTHDRWFGGDEPARIKPELIRQLAAENGFGPDDSLVSFCNTGHWAATNWFALSEVAGIEDVRLYPESVVGWSNAGYEMANVPGLFENLYNKIFGRY